MKNSHLSRCSIDPTCELLPLGTVPRNLTTGYTERPEVPTKVRPSESESCTARPSAWPAESLSSAYNTGVRTTMLMLAVGRLKHIQAWKVKSDRQALRREREREVEQA